MDKKKTPSFSSIEITGWTAKQAHFYTCMIRMLKNTSSVLQSMAIILQVSIFAIIAKPVIIQYVN